MKLTFSKMQGLGNDFVVIDGVTRPVTLTPEQIRHLADRHLGVGCDQVLMVEPAQSPAADYFFRIFNNDGSQSEQCGNGARCLAVFLLQQGLTDKTEIKLETSNGFMVLRKQPNGHVVVDMGVPQLDPGQIPFLADARAAQYSLIVDNTTYKISAVSMGNPHAVLVVPSVAEAPVLELGPKIEAHEKFPNRVNVGFMQVVDRSTIQLRVFERGCGETLACGSGACAAMVAGRLQGLLDKEVSVMLPGGELVISWAAETESVSMSGPATFVFEGSIEL